MRVEWERKSGVGEEKWRGSGREGGSAKSRKTLARLGIPLPRKPKGIFNCAYSASSNFCFAAANQRACPGWLAPLPVSYVTRSQETDQALSCSAARLCQRWHTHPHLHPHRQFAIAFSLFLISGIETAGPFWEKGFGTERTINAVLTLSCGPKIRWSSYSPLFLHGRGLMQETTGNLLPSHHRETFTHPTHVFALQLLCKLRLASPKHSGQLF